MDAGSPSRRRRNDATAEEPFLAEIDSCWADAATALRQCGAALSIENAECLGRQLVELALFLRLCRASDLPAPASRCSSPGQANPSLPDWIAWGREQIGPALLGPATTPDAAWIDDPSLGSALRRVADQRIFARLAAAPPEILGEIHQRLLGLRLVRSGARHWAVNNPGTRRRGGVYYTPQCVVRYIVANTLGEQLGAATIPSPLFAPGPSPACERGEFSRTVCQNLRILDPACGCGSFLLGACRYLIDRFRQCGVDEAPCAVARCLYGVDIDPDAVLTARRSLWLELLDGSGMEGCGSTATGLARAILDDMTGNVRCGDALADSTWPEDLAHYDVVIGNPPYRRELHAKRMLDRVADTPWGRQHRAPRMDLWYYFVHRGLELLRPGGRLSYIVDSYWTTSRGAAKLVLAIQEKARIEEIFSLGQASVFTGVSGRHMILRLVKGAGPALATVKRAAAAGPSEAESLLCGGAPLAVFRKTEGQLFRGARIDLEPPADELLAKLASRTPLGRLGRVRQGIVENPAGVTAAANRQHGSRWQVGEGVFALTPAEASRLQLPETASRVLRPYHDLCDLGRYFLADVPSLMLIYSTRETCPQIDEFPALRAHLARFRPILEARRETRERLRPWWQLHWPREEAMWRAGKVISVQMARRPAFVAGASPVYVPFSANVFVPHAGTRESLDYFAALLNSRLLWKWFAHHAKRRGVGLEINGHVLADAPIRTIDFADDAQRDAHDRLAALARQMSEFSRLLRAVDPPQARGALESQLSEIDRRIDQAVYTLYDLSEAEISLVDGADLDY